MFILAEHLPLSQVLGSYMPGILSSRHLTVLVKFLLSRVCFFVFLETEVVVVLPGLNIHRKRGGVFDIQLISLSFQNSFLIANLIIS